MVLLEREQSGAPRRVPLTRGRAYPFRYFGLLNARRSPPVAANMAVRGKTLVKPIVVVRCRRSWRLTGALVFNNAFREERL